MDTGAGEDDDVDGPLYIYRLVVVDRMKFTCGSFFPLPHLKHAIIYSFIHPFITLHSIFPSTLIHCRYLCWLYEYLHIILIAVFAIFLAFSSTSCGQTRIKLLYTL